MEPGRLCFQVCLADSLVAWMCRCCSVLIVPQLLFCGASFMRCCERLRALPFQSRLQLLGTLLRAEPCCQSFAITGSWRKAIGNWDSTKCRLDCPCRP